MCLCVCVCVCVTVALTCVVVRSYIYIACVWLLFLPQVMTFLVSILWTPFLASSLIFMHCYLWSRFNHTTQVSIMGMVTVQAFYLPWCLVGLSCMMGASPVADLLVRTHTRTLVLLHAWCRSSRYFRFTDMYVCVCVCVSMCSRCSCATNSIRPCREFSRAICTTFVLSCIRVRMALPFFRRRCSCTS